MENELQRLQNMVERLEREVSYWRQEMDDVREICNRQLRNKDARLACVRSFCEKFDCGRGIWKQIDENRQLLQFLFDEFPEVKERAFFIESWVGDTDYFLNCLAELLDLKEPSPTQFFPRPWPGKGCDPRVEACSRAASIKKTFVGKHEENSDGNRLS